MPDAPTLARPMSQLTPSFLVFDNRHKLVYWSIKPEDDCADFEQLLIAGLTLDTLTAMAVEIGLFDLEGWDFERYIARRRERFENGNVFPCRMRGNRWFNFSDKKGEDGTTLTTLVNVSWVERRERALGLLLGDAGDKTTVFERAAEALAIGLGFRNTSVARLLPGNQEAETMAFYHNERFITASNFRIKGTPCEPVYRDGFYSFTGDFLSEFPQINLDTYFADIGHGTYVGQVVYDSAGRAIGHVLAMDETERALDSGDRRMIRLVAKHVGFEIDRLDSNAELEAAKEAAEKANESKSQFLANVSHELRTPLNAILGFSEMMRHGVLGPMQNKRYSEYINDIHASGTHLLDMINDILDLSKAEAGKLELNLEPVNVEETVQAIIRLVRDQAEAADVRLLTMIGSNLPTLYGDSRRLKQVLINLISNSIKFTPPKGSVEVIATREDDGLALAVNDTGIGIAPGEMTRVLTPFGQIDSDMARKHTGTGLGLPLAKRLVELHGGQLRIASQPGVGTHVTAYFPSERLDHPAAPTLTVAKKK